MLYWLLKALLDIRKFAINLMTIVASMCIIPFDNNSIMYAVCVYDYHVSPVIGLNFNVTNIARCS